MLCNCYWIVHFTAFSLGGPFIRTRCISKTMHHVVKRLQKLAKLNIQTKVEFFLSRGRMRSTILGVNMNVVII